MNNKTEFHFLLSTEHRYEHTYILTARVAYLKDGEHRYPSNSYLFKPEFEFADLHVTAYVDQENEGPWGCKYFYNMDYVTLSNAEAMVKVLRRLQRGLDKLNAERGYLEDKQFAEYLMRVGDVLKIRNFYVRNSDKAAEVSGSMFRSVDGAGLQRWVSYQVQELRKQS